MTAETEAEIQRLALAGCTLQAARLYREAHNVCLSSAAEAVRRIQAGPDRALRDRLAGQIIAGMYASLTAASDWPEPEHMQRMAEVAYLQADALLAERDKVHG
ncbi:hypothetical protein [Roseomonas sp. USHLN139]|uniref:hypothetical protein n=1 Tax=Roseomonas sp. USHLN139 TaxID=3081298 RepID=UPI003B02ACC4